VAALVSSFTDSFRTLPFAQLRRNRYFYFYYDGFYAALCLGAIALMRATGHAGLFGEGAVFGPWSWAYLGALPIVCYALILCNAITHQCTHGSLPKPWNRIVGELAGMVVVTRFASWEVLHQRHHRYSDDVAKDPHPVNPSYLGFCWHHLAHIEKTLVQIALDVHGDTPENRRIEKLRSLVSFGTGVLLVSAWYHLLGFHAFLFLFLPAGVVGFFQLVHFNWATHDPWHPRGSFQPVNLDHGVYRLMNRLVLGIYMHANHHKRPHLLNPSKMEPSLPVLTREEIAAQIAEKRALAAQAQSA